MSRLIPLADYQAPPMPTETAVRKALHSFSKRLRGSSEGPMLSASRLESASLQGLDEIGRPLVSLLGAALDEELGGDWLNAAAPKDRIRLIVSPPGDDLGMVERWAAAAGHQLLQPPARIELMSAGGPANMPELGGHGPLVIARLEHWFVRQRNGLQALKSLLTELVALRRPCLIGCNSWAWRYLVKAIGADALLPQPLTWEAFDAARLQQWFAGFCADEEGQVLTYRLASNGADVLELDADGAPKCRHLRQLAARSQGIPWVAGELWRASLSVRTASKDLPDRVQRATTDDERTVWVSGVNDCGLPPGYEERARMILHALLIHGELSVAELDGVLPATGEPDLMPALLASGLLCCDDGRYRVRALAYPGVRRALAGAGFPLGRM